MKSITKMEYIGLNIIVAASTNANEKGMKGKIIDETKNTFVVKTEKGSRTLLKKNITISIPKLKIRIKGELLAERPEERIKKK